MEYIHTVNRINLIHLLLDIQLIGVEIIYDYRKNTIKYRKRGRYVYYHRRRNVLKNGAGNSDWQAKLFSQ